MGLDTNFRPLRPNFPLLPPRSLSIPSIVFMKTYPYNSTARHCFYQRIFLTGCNLTKEKVSGSMSDTVMGCLLECRAAAHLHNSSPFSTALPSSPCLHSLSLNTNPSSSIISTLFLHTLPGEFCFTRSEQALKTLASADYPPNVFSVKIPPQQLPGSTNSPHR